MVSRVLYKDACRLYHRGLSLWRPAVPPVDAGSSHWQFLSVLVFIPYEYWSSLFRLMLLRNMYTGDGAVGVTTMSSLVAPRVVFVTACGATGICGVVTLTAPTCSSVYTPRIYKLSFRRVQTYWYLNSFDLKQKWPTFFDKFSSTKTWDKYIFIYILQAVSRNPNWKMSVLVEMLTWRCLGVKPLPEPVMT